MVIYGATTTRTYFLAIRADLIAFCKERIAGYKCPRSVDLRAVPVPMPGAGKVLKRELRRPFWQDQDRQVS
jgi:long-chain acyl-CoA synthetase